MHDLDVGLRERIQWLIDNRAGGVQRELSRMAGLNAQHMSTTMQRLRENPNRTIELPTLVKLAKAGGVTVDWLTAEGDIVPPPEPKPASSPSDPLRPSDVRGRVWLALHALPRDAHGKPPSLESFKRQPFIGKQVHKLLTGIRDGAKLALTDSDAALLAGPLCVDPDWLQKGAGSPPEPPPSPVPPQPPPKHQQADLLTMATDERGNVSADNLKGRRDTFQDALVAGYASELTKAEIQRVKGEHFDPKRPDARTLEEWKTIFHQAMVDVRKTRKPRAKKKPAGEGTKPKRLASGDT